MKNLVAGFLVMCSFSAIAGVEVVCDTKFTTTSAASFFIADTNRINERIKYLERRNFVVEVTQMSTAISYGLSSGKTSSGDNRNYEGGADKVCVVLKYK